MRTAAALLLLSSAAHAGPLEIGVDVTGSAPAGESNGRNPMSYTVGPVGGLGVSVHYRLSGASSVGVHASYGLANDREQMTSSYTLTSDPRLIRFGAEWRREIEEVVVGVGAGYELMYITHRWLDQMNREHWRGFELAHVSAGFRIVAGGVTVTPYVSVSLGMFDYRSRNDRGQWIADERSDDGGGGLALHGWVTGGARMTFRP